MDIDVFKNDIKTYPSDLIVRSHILSGDTHVLESVKYVQLREDVGAHFRIDSFQVFMVGSGKMGFSIKPTRRYGEFNNESDIDLAIISPDLFQRVWEIAYKYKISGAYWPKQDAFFEYLISGWIRPDKFPNSEIDPFFDNWWNFFNTLTRSRKYGHYKIRAGLYQSRFFLEQYQKICIEQCKEII